MSGISEIPQPHADLTEEAAAWLAALDSGSADMSAFEAWRNADVRHAIAFAEVASAWRDMDGLRVTQSEMPRPRQPEQALVETPNRRHFLRAAASIGVVAIAGGGVAYRAYARDSASTRVGERKTIAATKGLSLDLNTDSEIYWKDGAPARLWMERGEVAIRLAATQRLELLASGGRFALAPGSYNARLRGAGCELAVIAGAIVDEAGRRIGPGEIAMVTAGRADLQPRESVDLGRVTAWRNDTLVLNGESLDYALAEMNRYLRDKIVIGDPALSRLRLGGTFSTKNPSEFLQALHTSFGVRATAGADGGIVLTRG